MYPPVATEPQAYGHYVVNQSSATLTISNGGATTVALSPGGVGAAGKHSILWFNAGGVFRWAAEFTGPA